MPDSDTPAPDPATSYERAKPHKESPGGQLDQPKPPQQKEQDHLQEHNSAPDLKHAQQKQKP